MADIPIQRVETEPTNLFGGKRNGLRASFVNREKTHYESRIKDLEKTLAINKQIISELLSTPQDKEYDKYKGIFDKMKTESKFLNDQLKNALKQRDDYHAKLLISEQIAENQMRRNEETACELQSQIKDLLEQLNQKEFTLQHIEHCYKKAILMLSKFVNKDCEVFTLLHELNSGFFNFKTLKISDVIEENRCLKAKLKENEDKVEKQIENIFIITIQKYLLDYRLCFGSRWESFQMEQINEQSKEQTLRPEYKENI